MQDKKECKLTKQRIEENAEVGISMHTQFLTSGLFPESGTSEFAGEGGRPEKVDVRSRLFVAVHTVDAASQPVNCDNRHKSSLLDQDKGLFFAVGHFC